MTALDAIDIDALAAEHDVPGAAVGLISAGAISARALGVLSTATALVHFGRTLTRIR